MSLVGWVMILTTSTSTLSLSLLLSSSLVGWGVILISTLTLSLSSLSLGDESGGLGCDPHCHPGQPGGTHTPDTAHQGRRGSFRVFQDAINIDTLSILLTVLTLVFYHDKYLSPIDSMNLRPLLHPRRLERSQRKLSTISRARSDTDTSSAGGIF